MARRLQLFHQCRHALHSLAKRRHRGGQDVRGGTRREDLSKYAYRPDLVVESIAELTHERILRELHGSNVPATRLGAPQQQRLQAAMSP